jgi:aldehyde dehydrogenase (NAD+)
VSVKSEPEALAPALLDGGPKQLLIGGEWLQVVWGGTFATVNPSTGEVLAQIADGDREDADRAGAAARRAADGPWKRFTPAQRQNVLLKLAELALEHYEELRPLDILEMGVPISPGLDAGAEENDETLRYYAGWATKIHGETVTPSVPASFFAYTLKQPVGVVGAIVPWNAPLSTAIEKIALVSATRRSRPESCVNTYNQFDPAMPFGGCKMSGGREISIHSLDEYRNIKAVWVKTG